MQGGGQVFPAQHHLAAASLARCCSTRDVFMLSLTASQCVRVSVHVLTGDDDAYIMFNIPRRNLSEIICSVIMMNCASTAACQDLNIL